MKIFKERITVMVIGFVIEPTKQDQGYSTLTRDAFNQEADQIPCKNFSSIHGAELFYKYLLYIIQKNIKG